MFFSNDAVSVVVLLASFFTLYVTAGLMINQIYRFLRFCLGLAAGAGSGGPAAGPGASGPGGPFRGKEA